MDAVQAYVLTVDGWCVYGQKARKQREEAKQRKEENQRKSMVVQTITNPKTLKKMMASKKDRKKLMKADTLKSVG